jgi:hypothetical protein
LAFLASDKKEIVVKKLHYYKLSEAEELKRTYSSWIGKKAHAGNGSISTLKSITIKQKRSARTVDANDHSFIVEFEFENRIRFRADEFLNNNGLSVPVSAS